MQRRCSTSVVGTGDLKFTLKVRWYLHTHVLGRVCQAGEWAQVKSTGHPAVQSRPEAAGPGVGSCGNSLNQGSHGVLQSLE